MRHLLLFFIFQILSGCFYRKITISDSERQIISCFKENKYIVLNSDKGLVDTLFFKSNGNHPNGFESNFEHWWNVKLERMPRKSKREFYYSTVATDKFKSIQDNEQKLNVVLQFRLRKLNNSDKLILTVDSFKDEFDVSDVTNDTLIFRNPKLEISNNHKNYVENLVVHKIKGIISLKKNDGTLWVVSSNF